MLGALANTKHNEKSPVGVIQAGDAFTSLLGCLLFNAMGVCARGLLLSVRSPR